MPRKPDLVLRPVEVLPVYTTLPLIFGRCVSQLRRELKLTQGEFADKVKMERATLGSIESGRSAASVMQIMKFSRIFYEELSLDTYGDLMTLAMLAADYLQKDLGVYIPPNNAEPERHLPLETSKIDQYVRRIFDAMREDQQEQAARSSG